MENSVISNCHSRKTAENNCDSEEESSWTFYIQDFIKNNGEKSCFSRDDNESPSLVSDAASSAVVKRFVDFDSRNFTLSNNLKKKKPKGPEVDEDLVDTASSPVNSPKVSYMNQFMNQKERAAKVDVADQVKREHILGQRG